MAKLLPTSLNLSTIVMESSASTRKAFIVEIMDSVACATSFIPVIVTIPLWDGVAISATLCSFLLFGLYCRPDYIFTPMGQLAYAHRCRSGCSRYGFFCCNFLYIYTAKVLSSELSVPGRFPIKANFITHTLLCGRTSLQNPQHAGTLAQIRQATVHHWPRSPILQTFLLLPSNLRVGWSFLPASTVSNLLWIILWSRAHHHPVWVVSVAMWITPHNACSLRGPILFL